MKCDHIRELLSPYLDKLVSTREEEAIRSHLAQCPACRQILEELKKTQALVGRLEDVDPPPWLAQRIMAEVRNAHQEEKRIGFWKRLFYSWPIKVPVQVLATILVVIFAVQVYRLIEPSKITMPQPMEGVVMAPKDVDRQAPQEVAPPAVSSPGGAALTDRRSRVPVKPQKAPPPEQFRVADGSAVLKNEATSSRQAEEARIENGIALPSPQAAPHLEEKRAPAVAAKEEAGQKASMPAAAYNEDRPAAKADQGVLKKSKALSADSTLMGAAVVVPVAVPLTLRTPNPAAAATDIEAYLNSVRPKSFTKELHKDQITITATLSSDEAVGLIKKLKMLGSVSPGSYQAPRGETTIIRLSILQGN